MKYVVTAAQMKRYDTNTTEKIKIPDMVLMERAALAAFAEIEAYVQEKGLGACSGRRVLVLAGTGNNGGDGLALARLLSEAAYRVEVWCVGDREKASAQWKRQYEILAHYPVETGSKPSGEEYTVLVDALFGVGLSRDIAGEYELAVQAFNVLSGFKLSLDVPSGIDSDTGKVLGTAVKADMTLSFGFLKRGLLLGQGRFYCGRVKVVSAGIGEKSFLGEAPEMFCYDEPPEALLPVRSPAGNKGDFGKVLLIAGSFNMAGAALLTAKACYRTGAGMVKVLSCKENRNILQTGLPEALFGERRELKASLSWADVIAIGPGLSKEEEAVCCLREAVLLSSLPIILDADALNLLAQYREIAEALAEQGRCGRQIILTPHVGELSRLTGIGVRELKENLAQAAQALAEKLHAVVAAKDARTLVCRERGDFPAGSICLNRTGNSSMATAGSGDVLTGMIAGLLAQGMEAFEAASVGVYLHGKAGERAAELLGEHGVMAGDIIAALGADLNADLDAERKKGRNSNGRIGRRA